LAVLSKRDTEILKNINVSLTASYRKLSRQLNLPESTIGYRVLKLKNIDEPREIIGNILDLPGVEKSMINIVFQKT